MSFQNDFGYVRKNLGYSRFLTWLPDSTGCIYVDDSGYTTLKFINGSRPVRIRGLPHREDGNVTYARCIQKNRNTVYVWFIIEEEDYEDDSAKMTLMSYELHWFDGKIRSMSRKSSLFILGRIGFEAVFSADSKTLVVYDTPLRVYIMDDNGVIHEDDDDRYPWRRSIYNSKNFEAISHDGRYVISTFGVGDDFPENHRELDYNFNQFILNIIDRQDGNNVVFSMRCTLQCAKWSPVENKLVMVISEIDGRPQNLQGEVIKLHFFTTVWVPGVRPENLKHTILPRTHISTITEFNDRHRVELFNDLIWSPDGSKVFGKMGYAHRTKNIGYGRIIRITESPIFDCVGDSLVWRCNISTSEKMVGSCWSPDSKTVALVQQVMNEFDVYEISIPFFSADNGKRVLMIRAGDENDYEISSDFKITFSPNGSYLMLSEITRHDGSGNTTIFDLRQYSLKTHRQLAPDTLKEQVFSLMLVRHRLSTTRGSIPILPTEMWLDVVFNLAISHFENARLNLRQRYDSDLEPLWFLRGENAIKWHPKPPRPLPALTLDESGSENPEPILVDDEPAPANELEFVPDLAPVPVNGGHADQILVDDDDE